MTDAYVEGVMTADVASVRTDASYRDLAGILSRADVLSVFARPDEETRREITQDAFMDGLFLDPAPFTVTVEDGIVTLRPLHLPATRPRSLSRAHQAGLTKPGQLREASHGRIARRGSYRRF